MVDFTLTVPELISIYVDGVLLANATNYELNLGKTTNKVAVIGTSEHRIAEGSVEIGGSLTLLKTSDLATRLLRVKEIGNLDFLSLSKVNPAGPSEFDQGTAVITQTLNSGNLLYLQDFVATGTTLRQFYFIGARTTTFVNDVTIRLMNGVTPLASYTLLNSAIPTVKGQIEFFTAITDTLPTLTVGNTYSLEISIPVASAGQLDFYGGDVKELYLVGTGDGVVTDFDLAHSNVISGALFVRLGDDDGWLGQLEGYTFGDGTGTAGVDEIQFTTAPDLNTNIYAVYQHDTNNLIAWKLGMSNVTNPTYTIKYEMRNGSGTLLESYVIERVKFTSNGLAVNPASFIEQTLAFEGEVINTNPY